MCINWFKLMLDKNILYSYWYVGQNLNYYNDEKDATVTNPSLKVLMHTLF
jgi:lipopolysaccharide export system protein LptC